MASLVHKLLDKLSHVTYSLLQIVSASAYNNNIHIQIEIGCNLKVIYNI